MRTRTFQASSVLLWIVSCFALPLCHGQEEKPARPDDDTHQREHWQSLLLGDTGVTLQVPPVSAGAPSAGKRVAISAQPYAGTKIHHLLYLPVDWNPHWKEKALQWPVIVEYTGNHYPASGSTGKVEDAALGYGISGGHFIWVTLPFVSNDHLENEVRWWGDAAATVAYALSEVPRICAQFGGDAQSVFLCGFSRGAIATSYIGLHNAQIASLWRGFITHDHYDGVVEWHGTRWGSPLKNYRAAARKRLLRIGKRPVLICENGSTSKTARFLESTGISGHFTYLNVDTRSILGEFPNSLAKHSHNDRWLLVPSSKRLETRKWLAKALAEAAGE
ncbi:MAG: hypothetical protein ACI9R3_003701 [Verrucomicrobiales bacterium]|jgi:hypothetical protein